MPEATTGMIFDIQSYSVHDGPGCRTNVFFVGCPLQCRWCANPESWAVKKHLLFAERPCKWEQGCTACRNACPNGALTFDEKGKPVLDWTICNKCQTIECSEVCAAHALKQCVRFLTVDDLMKILMRDYPNWGSDGGVTFSGCCTMSFLIRCSGAAARSRCIPPSKPAPLRLPRCSRRYSAT